MTTTANEPGRQGSRDREIGRLTMADTPHPQVALLSNGTYSVMISGAGSGTSAWRDLDVTRWREDATRDCWGQFAYVRCLEDGKTWSIVQGLPVDDDARKRIDASAQELISERDAVKDLLGPAL